LVEFPNAICNVNYHNVKHVTCLGLKLSLDNTDTRTYTVYLLIFDIHFHEYCSLKCLKRRYIVYMVILPMT